MKKLLTLLVFSLFLFISIEVHEASGQSESGIPYTDDGFLFSNGYYVTYTFTTGKINEMKIIEDTKSLIISLESQREDAVSVTIDRSILDAKSDESDEQFLVLINGIKTEVVTYDTTYYRILGIPLPKGVSTVEIIGTHTIFSSLESDTLINESETKSKTELVKIPDWIKNNADWWADDIIGDSDFVSGIQYLINEGIMTIPTTLSGQSTSENIPVWVKNNAGWWAEGQIDDGTFVSSIQFLVKNGIIVVEKEIPARTTPKDSDKTFDVIVIGAGMSGIAAADKLDSQGFDVVILEARDRIGGRTWTTYWDEAGILIDMGAGWIHGTTGNPITKIAEDNGIELLETDLNSGVLLGANGKWLDDDTYDEIELLYQDFQEYRWEFAETVDKDTSVKAAEDSFVKLKNLSKEQQNQLRFMINTALEHEESADASDLSLWTVVGKEISGKEVIFPKGYIQILKTLDDGLDIRLEHVVSKIQYDDEEVSVFTNQGSFEAKYVISTLPIGVLKAGDVEFSPPLPAAKQQAIDRIGMGVLNKLYLLFDDVFWDNVTLLNYVSPDGSSMWEFFNLNDLGKPILLGFTTGEHSRQLEQVSDDEVVNNAMSVLEKMYGSETLEPIDYVRTKWGSDPYSKGAYSFTGVSSTEADYTALAEPVKGRVFFAGEATYMDYTATVNGAYLSGIREAERISEIYE